MPPDPTRPVDRQTEPRPIPDEDALSPPRFHPFAGPFEAVVDPIPLHRAQKYADVEQELSPGWKMAHAMFSADPLVSEFYEGHGITDWAEKHGLDPAKSREQFFSDMAEDKANYEEFTRRLANRNMRLTLDRGELTRLALEKMRAELGPEYTVRYGQDMKADLFTAAMIQVAVEHSTLDDFDGSAVAGVIQKQIMPTMRAPVDMTPAEFWADMGDLERFKYFVEAPEMNAGLVSQRPFSQLRAVAERWHQIRTGAPAGDVSTRELLHRIDPAVAAFRSSQDRAIGVAKWQKLGANLSMSQVGAHGALTLAESPFNRHAIDRALEMRALRIGEGDRRAIADWNIREQTANTLMERPGSIVTRLLPEAEGNPKLTQFLAEWVGKLNQIPDIDDRFRSFQHDATVGPLGIVGLGKDPLRAAKSAGTEGPQWTEEERAALRRIPEQWQRFQDEFAVKDLDRQEYNNKFLSADWDPRRSQLLAEAGRRLREEGSNRAMKIEAALNGAPITKAAFWVLDNVGKVVQALPLESAGIAMQELLDAANDIPMSEGMRLATPRRTPGEFVMRDVLGYTRDPQEVLQRYAERAHAGQTWALDDIGLAGNLLLDGLIRMPGMAADNPLEFALYGQLLHGWGKIGKGTDALMARAKVPVRLRGLVNLGLNPHQPLAAARQLLGWTPEFARQIGIGQAMLQRTLLRTGPQTRAAVSRLQNYMLDQFAKLPRDHSPERVAQIRANMAAMMNRAERGTLSLTDLWDMDKQLGELQYGEARQLFVPLARARLGMISSALEGANQFADEIGHVKALEAALEKGTTKHLGTPLSKLMVDAFNAYDADVYAPWRARLEGRLAQRVLPKGFRTQLIGLLDRRIKLEDHAPHAGETFRAAAGAAQVLRESAAETANMYDITAETVRLRRRELISDMRKAKWRKQIGYKVSEAEAELAQLQQQFQSATGLERQLRTAKADIRRASAISLVEKDVTTGIEAGVQTQLSPEVKRVVARTMLDLAESQGEIGFGRDALALPMSWVELLRKGEAKFEKERAPIQAKADAVRRAQYRLLQHNDPAGAVERLTGKRPERPVTVEEAAAAIGRERESAEVAWREHRQNRMRWMENEGRLISGNEMYDIAPLDENYQTILKLGRQHVQAMRDLAEMEPGPAGTYLELINLRRNPNYTNRAMGLMDMYTAGINDVNTMIMSRLGGEFDLLSREAKEVYETAARLHPSQWSPELAQDVYRIAFEESSMRNVLFDQLARVGKITEKEAARYKNEAYQEHYYLVHEEAGRLRQLGVPIGGPPEKMDLPLARTPEYERLKVQRSPAYARQFWRDPDTGELMEKRFKVKDFLPEDVEEITPEDTAAAIKAATAAARAHRQKLIDQGWITAKHSPKEYTIAPWSEAEQAKLGIVDSAGLYRFDKIRQMFADKMRTDFFSHVAMMGGVKLRSLADVPLRQHGEWTKQRVKGGEWGPLEGYHLHKSIIRMLNTWDDWHTVMDAVAESVKDQIAAVWQPTQGILGKALDALLPGEGGGRWGKLVRWLDRNLRYHLIIQNPGSWVNNHMGAMNSAWHLGANPASPSYWQAHHRFYELLDQYTQGTLPESAEGLAFAKFAQSGGLTATAGIPGKFHLEKAARARPFSRAHFKATHERVIGQGKRHAYEAEKFGEAAERLQLEIEKESYTGDALTDAAHTLERFEILEQDARSKMIQEGVRSPVWEYAREVYRNVADPAKSQFHKVLAERYGLIDPSHRWATYQYLTGKKGWTPEAALDGILAYFQSYGAVPPWVRALKRRPLTGAFVPSFAYEAGRIVANALYYDPARFLAITSAPFIWNIANMAANGMLPSEFFSSNYASTRFEQLREMLFTLNVTTPAGTFRLNTEQGTIMAPFLRPTGSLRPLLGRAQNYLDQQLGPVASLPTILAGNYLSNFVVNTPYSQFLSRRVLGVDPFKQEITYSRFGDLGPLQSWARDLGQFVLPRVATRTWEEMERTGTTSLLTRHNVGKLQALTRGVTGLNVSSARADELFARAILKYSKMEQLGDTLRQSYEGPEGEARRASIAYAEAMTEADRRYWFEKAKRAVKEAGSGRRLIGATWHKVGLTDAQAAQRVVNYASRNLYQEIEKIPIAKLPLAIHDLENSKLKEAAPFEMEHMWRQLLDPDGLYLSSENDVTELAEAARSCLQYSRTGGDAAVRARYAMGYGHIMARLLQVIQNSIGGHQVQLLRRRMGTWPRVQMEEMTRRLGLMP